MSYEEKGVWVYLGVAAGTFALYVGVILSRAAGEASIVDVSYVPVLLWMLGVSVLARMVATMVVEAVRPSDSRRPDERDRRVNRFGEYIGGVVLAVAMLVPFVLAVLETAYFWIANAMYAAYIVQAVVSSAVKIVAYRRGV